MGGCFKLSAVFCFIGVNHGETSTIVNTFVVDRYVNLLSDTLDLEFASTGLDVNVRTVDTLDHLEDMDFVVFPALDVLPDKKRSEFASTLKELFRLVN